MAQPCKEPSGKAQLMVDTPDKGYAWAIVAASWLAHMLVLGMQYSFGVMFAELIVEYQEPRSTLAWVGSICVGCMLGFGVVVGALVARLGERIVIALGSLIAAVGLVLSSFTTSVPQLFLTYGVVLGIGHSMVQPPAMMIVQRWFAKRRALASGLAGTGSGVGSTALGPVLVLVNSRVGWRRTLQILSACSLLGGCLVASAVRRPMLEGQPRSSQLTHYWRLQANGRPGLLRRPMLLLLVVSVFATGLGWYVPSVNIVQFSKDLGVAVERISWPNAAMGLGLLLGRVPMCQLADWSGRRILVFAVCTFGIGLGIFFLAFARSLEGVLLACLFWGWNMGSFIALIQPVTKELVTMEELPQAGGLVMSAFGCSSIVGPPLAGMVYLQTSSYFWPFVGAALTCGCGAAIALMLDQRHTRMEATSNAASTEPAVASQTEPARGAAADHETSV